MKEHSSIEIRGVDMIPENERNSKASNVFYVLCGSQFAFGIMAIGSLPIVFGLGWWGLRLAPLRSDRFPFCHREQVRMEH